MRKLVAVVLGLGLVTAAFAGLALAMVLGLLTASVMVVARATGHLQPVRVNATHSRADARNGAQRDFRIWDDGRGKIIDM